jgi:uncharacterized repeat protein (TIGR01451 family)
MSIFLLLIVFNGEICGQGWVREWETYSGAGQDVEEAMNGDFIMAAYNGDLSSGPAYFVRMTPDGDTVWTKSVEDFDVNEIELINNDTIIGIGRYFNDPALVKLDGAGNLISIKIYANLNVSLQGIKKTINGEFIAIGTVGAQQVMINNLPYGIETLSFVKLDVYGNISWVQNRVDTFLVYSNWTVGQVEINPTSDGGFIVTGTKLSVINTVVHNNAYLIKLNATGGVMWEQELNLSTAESHAFSVKETFDGGYIVSGRAGDNSVLVKTNSSGVIQWTSTLFVGQFSSTTQEHWNPKDVIQDNDGNYLVTGGFRGAGKSLWLYKVNLQGVVLWSKEIINKNYIGYTGNKVKTNSDGGYIIVGNVTDFVIANWIFLCKVDSAGNAITTAIEGNVYADLNNNCAWDTLEYPLQNWVVIANGNNGQTYYANTDTSGHYYIPAEFGTYDVTLAVPNPYWDTVCIGLGTAILDTIFEIDTVDFPVNAAISCPLLHVDISSAALERCFASTYYVEYCNWGMADALNAYVEVELDPFLTYDTSSIAGVHLGGDLYRFNIGTVERGTCGEFWIDVMVTCDTNLIGITHCTEAHIYPDSICLSPWTGPNINVEGVCLGDTVLFKVMNTGGSMSSSLSFNIFEDNVMMMIGGYNLGVGQIEDVYVPAQSGKTYRIEARQVPNFPPLLGDTIVGLALEGCKVNSNGTINTGFVTQFSNYDGNPFVDVDCQPNVGSYDPNDKLAYPVGYGAEHYIYQHTDLDYYIRFQNTGTAAARTVVIIDTISEYLDIASLSVGASSHNYTYEIYGNGVVKFTFDNILLPDSTTNYSASQGFIKYSIEQKANNPIGTIINNNAAIYFDYNAPVQTNTTFHEIGTDFVTIQLLGLKNVLEPNVLVNVYPNPFHEMATVEIEGKEFIEIEFVLYDLTGRVLYQKTTNETSFNINKPDLTQGIYIYRIVADGKLLNTGKLIAR